MPNKVSWKWYVISRYSSSFHFCVGWLIQEKYLTSWSNELFECLFSSMVSPYMLWFWKLKIVIWFTNVYGLSLVSSQWAYFYEFYKTLYWMYFPNFSLQCINFEIWSVLIEWVHIHTCINVTKIVKLNSCTLSTSVYDLYILRHSNLL